MYGVEAAEIFDSGKESVIIRKYLNGITGGVVLDMTGFDAPFIKCGHVIIRSTKDGEYKPMPVGICMTTAPKDTPHVGVLTAGEVNDKAVPYPVEAIKAAFKTAVPTIQWGHDKIG